MENAGFADFDQKLLPENHIFVHQIHVHLVEVHQHSIQEGSDVLVCHHLSGDRAHDPEKSSPSRIKGVSRTESFRLNLSKGKTHQNMIIRKEMESFYDL